jgi:hypothetical protein
MIAVADMTDADMLDYLIQSATVPDNTRMSYAAGYFEGLLLTMMDRFPEVRQEIEARVTFRRREGF